MITLTKKNLEGVEHYTGSYGPMLLLDCRGCDPMTFTRENIEKFMKVLCEIMNMDGEDFHFWDDLDTPDEERRTEAHAKGTSVGGVFRKKIGLQFIITSSIVIHCLDVLKRCYVDVFSCKEFNEGDVKRLVCKYFGATAIGTHSVLRD